MEAGFSPLGTDFGNGARDALLFQRDEEWARYREAKEEVDVERHWAYAHTQEHRTLHARALRWLVSTQARELNASPSLSLLSTLERLERGLEEPTEGELKSAYHELALNAQEDLALLAEAPRSELIMGHVCMPSFWSPEHIKGASFYEIHKPVPGFPRDERVAERLGSVIATRGPLVRFVWTLTNDDRLDHHPKGGRTSWAPNQPLWLRVERQVTVPLSEAPPSSPNPLGALFLIRTYLYPLSSLSDEERSTLRAALEAMPEEVARYKGLWVGREWVIERLSAHTL
jgi:hypothetical protein